MKLNEEKRDKIADAIIKEFSGLFKYHHNDSRINRLKEALTPFCMEMTDEEIFEAKEKYCRGISIAESVGEIGDAYIDALKFIRDGN